MGTKAGVGVSYHRNPAVAGQEAAEMALKNGGIDIPDFVFMFATVGYNQPTLLNAVREATHNVPLSGCSGEGIITQSEADESNFSIAVMAICSNDIQFHNGISTGLAKDSTAVGDAAAAAIQPVLREDAVGLFVFPDALTTDFDGFKAGLEEALVFDRFLPILGGAASENRQFKQTYQYFNDQVVSDGVAWVLFSGRMKVVWGINHGCTPIGAERMITRCEGNVIYEIDGTPALEVLKEYMTADKINDWSQ
ncbi:hypothetical protein KFU94_62340 [Chloroflexi bacterium TSY]|nr:hypothetical protein [Chloroflexi bacterium TSY]